MIKREGYVERQEEEEKADGPRCQSFVGGNGHSLQWAIAENAAAVGDKKGKDRVKNARGVTNQLSGDTEDQING